MSAATHWLVTRRAKWSACTPHADALRRGQRRMEKMTRHEKGAEMPCYYCSADGGR